MKSHPGFKSVQKSIASKEGVSKESAGAILGAATRHTSAAARKANPHLNRVKGKMHEGGVVPEDGLYEMKKNEVVTPAKGTYGSVMQHAAAERPERPIPTNRERIKHIVVEAHGATDIQHTPEQHTRNHAQMTNERSEKHRETKSSPVTLGRHVTSGTRNK